MKSNPNTNKATANPENLHLVSGNSCITDQKKMNLIPLTEIITRIRKGTYQTAIQRIRTLAAQGETEEANKLKRNLPYFVFGIVEGTRKAENVVQANGIILDFDHVGDIEAFKKQAAEKIPNAKYVFRSPTDGVKVLILFRVPVSDRTLYKHLWELLAEEAENQMGIKPDPTHDMCRACFVSWDTELITTRNEQLDVEFWRKAVQADANPPLCSALASAWTPAVGLPISELAEVTELPEKETCGICGKSEVATPDDSTSTAVTDLSEYSISQAVDYLCRHKIDYNLWVKVGMALYNHLGSAGKKYWDRFLDNPNYPNESKVMLDRLWEGFANYPSIGIGSFFWVARQLGWQDVIPPPKLGDRWEDYPALQDLFGQKSDVPLDYNGLPQVLKDYLDILDQITDSSHGAKLTALLPIAASAIGNRIAIRNAGATHYCNIYAVIIGPSSISRKSTVINQALKCLSFEQEKLEKLSPQEMNEQRIVLNNVTQARLLNLLAINPNRAIVQTEFGGWMKELQKNYNMGMKAELTDMFDGNDKTVAKMEVNEYISKPAFSIVGGTTEEWLLGELKGAADQGGGFLQRLLVCLYRDIDVSKLDFKIRSNREAEASLKAWGKKLGTLNRLSGTHFLHLCTPAIEYRNEVYAGIMKEQALRGCDPLLSYSTRIYDNYFFRFCSLIFCLKHYLDIGEAIDNDRVASFFVNNRIDLETSREAMMLCDYYFANTRPFLADISEAGKLDNERKIVKKLQALDQNEIQHSVLLNKSSMDKTEFRRTMESLIEREAVFCRNEYGYNNKKTIFYRLNPLLKVG